jgi:hypothetical protein
MKTEFLTVYKHIFIIIIIIIIIIINDKWLMIIAIPA